MPDRLPSLVLLVGCWIPPAVAGLVAAGCLRRNSRRDRAKATYAGLAIFVLGYAAAWFVFQIHRMPPYIPGAVMDPTIATPRAIAGLAVVAGALVLPVSAIACAVTFRRRVRELRQTHGARPPA